MKKLFYSLLLLVTFATVGLAQSQCVDVEEIDGSPKAPCIRQLKVTNGTLSCPTANRCTLTISGGGGGSPGGSNTQLQYNDGGAFGGITGATTNGTVVTLTSALATTAFSPSSNDGAALGSATASFSDLFLASGALINFANGNAVITHSSGILTVSTGDLRVTTAGTNSASAVTVGGTQTLTNKTLTTPTIGDFTNATHNHQNNAGGGTLTTSALSGLGTGVATALGINVGSAGAFVTFNGAGGTPSSLTLTSATGLPPTTGISGWPANSSGVLTNNGSGTLSWAAAGSGLTVGTTAIASGTATRLLYETSGNVVGEISGATSDGTNLTTTSGALRATSPRITTSIFDANGLAIISLNPTASAVNSLQVTNGATGSPGVVDLAGIGSDSDIRLTLTPKGVAGVRVTSGVTTGSGTTAGFQVATNSLTTGAGSSFASSSVTSGSVVNIASTSTAAASSTLKGLNIAISGANASTAQTVTGAAISVTNTNATSGTNKALVLTASGATTLNHALDATAGLIVSSANTGAMAIGIAVSGQPTVGIGRNGSIGGLDIYGNTTARINLSDSTMSWSSAMLIGWTASTVSQPQDLILRRNAAAHLTYGAADVNGTPVDQTTSVQNAVTGSNLAGGQWTHRASLGTSQGVPGRHSFTAGAMIAASGTTQQTAVSRLEIGATKVLTNNSATTITNATAASNTVAGGVLDYLVEVFDGTDVQTEVGSVSYTLVNKGGAFSGNTMTKFGNSQTATSGTLTVTFAISAANPGVISVNANSSLTPSTGYPRITYLPRNLSQNAISIQ